MKYKRVTINFRNPIAIEWINAVPKGTRSATIERICLEHIDCPAVVRRMIEELTKELDRRQLTYGLATITVAQESDEISVAIDALGEI